MLGRPWPWLKARVEALLTTTSRTARALAPRRPQAPAKPAPSDD